MLVRDKLVNLCYGILRGLHGVFVFGFLIAEKTWADAGFLCVEDALSVYTAMDLAFESLKGVAGLLIGRVCQVGFNSNLAVRRITQDVQTYDRMRERRQDQLSYENQNPNTYGEHLVEGH